MNDEILTIEEIYERFDSEWVLLADPETTDMQEVIRGRLLWHSKDRDELYAKANELKPKHSAVLYTGELADDEVLVL